MGCAERACRCRVTQDWVCLRAILLLFRFMLKRPAQFNSYVSRVNPRDSTRHVIFSTTSTRPSDFAMQLNVSLANGWGIVRTITDLCLKLPEGKYVLVKDPNKVSLHITQAGYIHLSVCSLPGNMILIFLCFYPSPWFAFTQFLLMLSLAKMSMRLTASKKPKSCLRTKKREYLRCTILTYSYSILAVFHLNLYRLKAIGYACISDQANLHTI